MMEIFVTLWVVTGLSGWVFVGYRWKCLDDWTFYLFLPLHAPILGPFMWILPFIQD